MLENAVNGVMQKKILIKGLLKFRGAPRFRCLQKVFAQKPTSANFVDH